MQVANKTIIITGGGSGMGREMVLNLLSRGSKIITVDINKDSLAETSKLAGDKAKNLFTYVLDISNHEKVKEFYKTIISTHKHVDGLINNAGIIQPFVKVNDLEFKDIDRVMNINFYGLVYLTKAFLPHLLSRPEAHIVNTSSMGGFLPVPGQSVYGASKAAVKLFTEGLYAELLDTNVNVTVVFPGAIATNIAKSSGVATPGDSTSETKSKTMPADKAAEIIIKAMLKNKDRVCVGSDAKFMNFLYRLNPSYATRYIAKQMKSLLNK